LNADLKQFIATSPDKDLLQKWESLITVQMPRENSAIRPAGGGGGQHQSFVNIANTVTSTSYSSATQSPIFGPWETAMSRGIQEARRFMTSISRI
jgi:hypothetical protein